MKKVVLTLAIMGLFVSAATGGVVYLRGPNERGEGPLPLAVGDPMDPAFFGEFTVDIYAEDMEGFAGFQLLATFLDSLDQQPPGFWGSYSTPNPDFGGRAIVHNVDFLPEINHACMDQTVGLMSMEKEDLPFPPGAKGDYIDKSLPAEGDLTAVNPAEMVWPGHEGLTWLMSVNYWYSSDVPEGTYTIGVDDGNTAFGDTRGDIPIAIDYTLVTGSVTIGEVIPEPATMALLGMGILGLVGYGRKKIRK